MPIYDYACQACGQAVEVMHGVNEPGPARCDRCGGSMRKLLSPPAIVFKGSGWAKKDARAAAKPGAAKSGTDAQTDHQPTSAPGASKDASASANDGGSGSRTAAPDKPAGSAAGGNT